VEHRRSARTVRSGSWSVTRLNTGLVRDEMRMAAAELQQKGKRLGVGAGLVGGAGVLAFTAVQCWSPPWSGIGHCFPGMAGALTACHAGYEG
jgi:hypothetical protein